MEAVLVLIGLFLVVVMVAVTAIVLNNSAEGA